MQGIWKLTFQRVLFHKSWGYVPLTHSSFLQFNVHLLHLRIQNLNVINNPVGENPWNEVVSFVDYEGIVSIGHSQWNVNSIVVINLAKSQ